MMKTIKPKRKQNLHRCLFNRSFNLFVRVLIPPLVLSSLVIAISVHTISVESRSYNQALLNQTRDHLEQMMSSVEQVSLVFETDIKVVTRLKSILQSQALSIDDLRAMDYLINHLKVSVYSKPFLHSISIYYNNPYGRYITSGGGIETLEQATDTVWYDRYAQRDNQILWIESRGIRSYAFETEERPVLTVYKRLYNPGGLNREGFMVMNFLPEPIRAVLQSASIYRNQVTQLIHPDHGEILLSTDPDDAALLSPFLHLQDEQVIWINRKPYVLRTANLDFLDWQIRSWIPLTELYALPIRLTFISVVLLGLAFLISLLISRKISRQSSARVSDIITLFESAEKNEKLPESDQTANLDHDEYGYIIKNIISIFIQHNYLKVQLSERLYKQRLLELLALQSQINPHFLNNTLYTIYWQAFKLGNGTNVVTDMLEWLRNILAYTLASPKDSVTLAEEIKHCRSYIQIQKMRYRSIFDVVWDYEESCLQIGVFRLIVQPLLENSLYHGIKAKSGQGLIKVKIRHQKQLGRLSIKVLDNGIGMSREKLQEIRTYISRESEIASEHIGLYSVARRLSLFWGEDATLLIGSWPHLGTCVEIRINDRFLKK
jgi:two-component system sensor histidine kinase YesM